jgi:SAM-dependent methyltransferase
MSAFGVYARYYDLLYSDKDYAAEAGYVHGLIQQYSPGARNILEMGCGTGAHAAQFAALDYEVLGIDSGEGMLNRARQRQAQLQPELAERLTYSAGDVRSFRAGRHFDAVTALFHVLSYQVSNDDIVRTFATAAMHLAPGGIFLFDFWYGPAVLSDPPVARIKRMEDASTQVVRTAEPTMHYNENVAQVDYEVNILDRESGRMEKINERHLLRYLFWPELELYLQTAGMEQIHFSEWMSDAQPSNETWNVVMIGRKLPGGD